MLYWLNFFTLLLIISLISFFTINFSLFYLVLHSELLIIILFFILVIISISFSINYIFGVCFSLLILGGMELSLNLLILVS